MKLKLKLKLSLAISNQIIQVVGAAFEIEVIKIEGRYLVYISLLSLGTKSEPPTMTFRYYSWWLGGWGWQNKVKLRLSQLPTKLKLKLKLKLSLAKVESF